MIARRSTGISDTAIRKLTTIRKLRSTSQGLLGTVTNAKHHAKSLLPMIYGLARTIPDLGYAEWAQGNNVHVLTTHDGRQLVFRPLATKGAYYGISIASRISRSLEVPLFNLYADERNGMTVSSTEHFLSVFADQPEELAPNKKEN